LQEAVCKVTGALILLLEALFQAHHGRLHALTKTLLKLLAEV
jgi:hypothetical protein